MKAIRLIKPGQALELREIELPTLKPGEALVRIEAAGICHSDAHYRAGKSRVEPLPLTLGHEGAGVVEQTAADQSRFSPGDRVCVHYLATCGACFHCQAGQEQFCVSGQMIGKLRDGAYAEFIAVPERSLLPLPAEVSFEHGAVMMCSSATSLHALKKARLQAGESVAIFGAGGLGLSAIQLAKALGAATVYAIDISEENLALAEKFGATAVNARRVDAVKELEKLTASRGVNVSLELAGLPETMRQAVQVLGIKGRAAMVGISDQSFPVTPYPEVINKEAEIIGVSDHLAQELPLLLQFARRGLLDLGPIVRRRVPLEAKAVNDTLDNLQNFREKGRVVIVPGLSESA